MHRLFRVARRVVGVPAFHFASKPLTSIRKKLMEEGGDSKMAKTFSMQKICAMINVKVMGLMQFYDHNEGIRYPEGGSVQLYDASDRLLGEMSLRDAMARAHEQKLDLVMRNSATNPATVKMMDYKREVFRKLLMRLGKRFVEEEQKRKKFIVLSSNIKSHDLHNRIKVAHNILKKNSILQVYMPIDIVSEESMSKGRLVLKTFMAELANASKIHKEEQLLEDVPDNIFRYSQKLMTGVEGQDFEDHDAIQRYMRENYSSPDKQRAYILVELLSTVNEKDFDIVTILETQTLDTFIESFYTREDLKDAGSSTQQGRALLKEQGGLYSIFQQKEGTPSTSLQFESEDFFAKKQEERERLISKQAIESLRQQKAMRKQSAIFRKGGQSSGKSYSEELDLTQLSEEQEMLEDLETALEQKETFSNSELLLAKYEELDAESRKRLYKLMKVVDREESKLKVKWAMKEIMKHQEMFPGPD